MKNLQMPRLWFVDFGHAEDAETIAAENKIFAFLREFFEVRLDRENPELIIYSRFGFRHHSFLCPRVCVLGENQTPDFGECDWAFSFEPTGGRNFRFPLWAWQLGNPARILPPPPADPAAALAAKCKFCAFVVSSPIGETRNRFFHILSAKKRVDAAGRLFNNTPGLSDRFSDSAFVDLPRFYRDYKFVVAFENSASPGYTTEKIMAALVGGAVPIYWGDPNVAADFDSRCFIHARDFDSLESLADYVLRVDADDDLYLSYLRAPRFVGGAIPPDADWRVASRRFAQIFTAPISPVARSRFIDREILPRLPRHAVKLLTRGRRKKQNRRRLAPT